MLIARYQNATAFEYRHLGEDPAAGAELAARWPLSKFPVLVDDGKAIMEARLMDRCFDNYFMTPIQKVVGDRLRAEPQRDPHGVTEARKMLATAYRWLDGVMARRTWAAGESFALADCAAAPALFYADWVQEIDPQFARMRAYRTRLLARPSFVRAVNEARPHRQLFPLGAPARD